MRQLRGIGQRRKDVLVGQLRIGLADFGRRQTEGLTALVYLLGRIVEVTRRVITSQLLVSNFN